MWDGWVSSMNNSKEGKLYVNRAWGSLHLFFLCGMLANTTHLYTVCQHPQPQLPIKSLPRLEGNTHKLCPRLWTDSGAQPHYSLNVHQHPTLQGFDLGQQHGSLYVSRPEMESTNGDVQEVLAVGFCVDTIRREAKLLVITGNTLILKDGE